MSTLSVVYPQRLTASLEDRTLSGLGLPYDEVGYTNLGAVRISAGRLTLPTDPASIVLNHEHDRLRPLGRATALVETAAGISPSFKIAGTTAGTDALIEAREGLRTGLSVEIADPVIIAGELISGVLTGFGHVTDPAFPSAQLAAAMHPDTTSPEAIASANQGDTMTTTATEETAAAPAVDLTAAATPANTNVATTAPCLNASRDDLLRIMAAYNSGARTPTLMAALSDIVPGDILGIEQPQYVGQLWTGNAYQRRFVPLFNHADLASFKVRGWRWVTKPEVAAYAGNLGAVHSNDIETEPVEIDAARIAGAHAIDRKFRDFNDTAFFAAYFDAMTESYKKVSDAAVRTAVYAAAPVVTPGTVPAGVNAGLAAIVDGIIAVLNETDGTMPDWSVVALDVWRDLMLVRTEDALAYLNAALGFENGELNGYKLLPMPGLTAGDTLTGCRSAVTVHELGGEAPIRVEAVDIARGGIDEGVFGYMAVNVHDDRGLARVSTVVAGG